MEPSEHASLVDAVTLLSESSSALKMLLPCPGDVHSKA